MRGAVCAVWANAGPQPLPDTAAARMREAIGSRPLGGHRSVGRGYVLWTALASVATKKWRIVVMTPAIALIDIVYRVTFVHALVKTIRQPRVSSCRWVSPARY